MSQITIEGLDRRSLNEQENNALDILVNLSLDKFNQIKQILSLDVPGVVGKTTLSAFLEFCQEKSVDLSDSGVEKFKNENNVGNTGVLKGVIGPQTAGLYGSSGSRVIIKSYGEKQPKKRSRIFSKLINP
jgi:hypothetical protein